MWMLELHILDKERAAETFTMSRRVDIVEACRAVNYFDEHYFVELQPELCLFCSITKVFLNPVTIVVW